MYYAVAKRGIQNGFFVSLELSKAIIPVYFLIKIMEKSGALHVLAEWCTPFMKLLGLPGEASLLLVIGNCLNIYSVLGAMQAMDLTIKQINIIAFVLLISHGIFVENAVIKKTRINALSLSIFRLVLSIACGIFLNIIL